MRLDVVVPQPQASLTSALRRPVLIKVFQGFAACEALDTIRLRLSP